MMANLMSHQVWGVDRQRLIVIVVGSIVYAILWSLEYLLNLPNLLNVSILPAVAIPIFCGLIWGPTVGFIVGALGVFLGDYFVTDIDFALYWDFGAGLLGLIAGLSTTTARFFQSWRDYLVAELWVLLSIYVSLDYTVSRQVLYEGASSGWDALFVDAFRNLSINALILVPVLIWIYYRFNKQKVFGS
ncbi:MAG: ECF transporter S component [Chloroflexota bacterium]